MPKGQLVESRNYYPLSSTHRNPSQFEQTIQSVPREQQGTSARQPNPQQNMRKKARKERKTRKRQFQSPPPDPEA
jgi:hypothetical protein